MTREQAKRRAELYSALAAGKIIQVQNPETGKWEYLDLNKFDGFMEEYNFRIKPEPKYRPFKTKEECWNEMHKHPDFGWLIKMDTGIFAFVNIKAIFSEEIVFDNDFDNVYTFKNAFKYYKFIDGTPFGIKLPTNI